MKNFLKNNLVLLLLYLLCLVNALYYIGSYSKTDLHLKINAFVGNAAIDRFFFYITYLGDGNMAMVMLLILLFYNIRLGIYCTASFLLASLSSVGLKHFFFDDVNRPFYVFTYYEHIQLKLVDGVQIYIHNSFPSGHATQAFAIFMAMAFAANKQMGKLLLFSLALLTAFSRVYLSQHWLQDVTAGSVVGCLFSLVLFFLLFQKASLQKLNRPLIAPKKIV